MIESCNQNLQVPQEFLIDIPCDSDPISDVPNPDLLQENLISISDSPTRRLSQMCDSKSDSGDSKTVKPVNLWIPIDADNFNDKKAVQRSRTKSWEGYLLFNFRTQTVKEDYFQHKRGFSPPVPRKPNVVVLDLKQLKAMEIRESLKIEKTEKLKVQSEKVQAVIERKRNEKKQQETRLEEKLTPRRNSKPKNNNNSVSREQTAASRRKVMEEERLLKMKEESERKHEQAEERLEKERLREAEVRSMERLEKIKRQEAFQNVKLAEESERQRKILEKSELGSKRREETLEMVKEKAAAANQQAKEVSIRVSEYRKTPDKHRISPDNREGAEHGDLSTFHSNPLVRSKALKKRLKRIRSNLHASVTKIISVKSSTIISDSTRKFETLYNDMVKSLSHWGVTISSNAIGVEWSVDSRTVKPNYAKKLESYLDVFEQTLVSDVESTFFAPNIIEFLVVISAALDANNSSLLCLRYI